MLLHVGIASMRQFQHVTTAYITEQISKGILKLTLVKYNPDCICSFPTCQAANQC